MSEPCSYEQNVIDAASRDEWSESLRQHISTCESCSSAAAIAPWMSRFGKIRDREHMLPDPTVLWLKAQLLRGSETAHRAARPIQQAQIIAYLTVAAGWAGLLTWKWDAVEAWASAITPAGMLAASTTNAMTSSFLLTVLVLGSLTIALAVHAVLAEE